MQVDNSRVESIVLTPLNGEHDTKVFNYYIKNKEHLQKWCFYSDDFFDRTKLLDIISSEYSSYIRGTGARYWIFDPDDLAQTADRKQICPG